LSSNLSEIYWRHTGWAIFTVCPFQNVMTEKITGLISIFFLAFTHAYSRIKIIISFGTQQGWTNMCFIKILRILKHFNVNLRFIGKYLKTYKEIGQKQSKNKTGRNRSVKTNEDLKSEGAFQFSRCVKWPKSPMCHIWFKWLTAWGPK
jgi:hypothetical protein